MIHRLLSSRARFATLAAVAAGAAGAATAVALGSAGAQAATTTGVLVVAPNGSDSNPGTVAQPLATPARAVALAKPGTQIELRGGTYTLTSTLKITTSGTAAARITLTAYQGEHAVLDGRRLSSGAWDVSMSASYWTVNGLEIANAPGHGIECKSCGHDTLSRLNVHDNGDTGLDLTGANTVGNTLLDIDSHHNHDNATQGQNADGIGIKFGSGAGNTVIGARLYDNSDDGLDMWEFTSPVTVRDSWSWGNGVNRWNIPGFTGNGNGFKLGGGRPTPAVNHVIINSAAWDNTANGFTENGNTGRITLWRDTAYHNGATGFYFALSSSWLFSDASVSNGAATKLGARTYSSGNSWNGGSWSAASFVSTDPTTAEGPRKADGSLPATSFLVPRTNTGVGAPMT